MKDILNSIQEQVEKVKAKRKFTKEELYEIWDGLGFTFCVNDDVLKLNLVKSLQDAYFYCQKTSCSQGFLELLFSLIHTILTNGNYKKDYVKADDIYWMMNQTNTDEALLEFLNKIRKGEYIPSDDETYSHLGSYYYWSVLKIYTNICGVGNKNVYEAISALFLEDYTISEEGKKILELINVDILAELTIIIAEYYVYISKCDVKCGKKRTTGE